MYKDRYREARKLGFRSGLEVRLAHEMDEKGHQYMYEQHTIRYTMPEEEKRYTPDFFLPNGIIIEGKGRWETADRKKIKLVKEQYPDLDLRMVFDNPNQRISKQSNTTYADVCTRLKIPFAKKSIPEAWILEAPVAARLDAMEAACGNPQFQKS